MSGRSTLSVVTAINTGITSALVGGTVLSPIAQASAPTSAFAIIGKISASVGQLAIDMDDDTVYGTRSFPNALDVIAPGATAGAAASSLALPGRPGGLAVDSDDDTVYIRDWSFNNSDRKMWASRAGELVDDTIPLAGGLISLAVNSADDTVFGTIMFYQNDDSLVAINGAITDDSTQRLGVGGGTYGMDIDQATDTVWVAGLDTNSVRTVDGATLAVTSVPGSFAQARDLVVSSTTHQAYVSTTVSSAPTLQKVDASGSLATWSDPRVLSMIYNMSINSTGSRLAFSTGNNDDSLWIFDTTTMQPEAAPLSIPAIGDTAQAASGLVYVARYDGGPVQVVAEVQGSLSASSAAAGDSLNVSITPTPAIAEGRPVVVDDSTLASVSFGGFVAPVTPAGTNAFSVVAPSGPTGTVEAVATLAGGATLSLGNVNFGGGSSTPVPATPASAPSDVQATPSDRAASVAWSAPASSGSFPVSTYQVTSSPGGRTCLTSALTCEIAGLTNGTAYTFTVKALTGAGWSAASAPSNAVTPTAPPRPTITITGSRDGKRIKVSGTTTGFGMGGELVPWVRLAGQRSDIRGSTPILVNVDGTFDWSRRTSKRAVVYVATPDGSARSNAVVIAAR